MAQKNSSNYSQSFKALGQGKILPYLIGDIKKAQEEIIIFGPWLDAYFINEVISNINDDVSLQLLIRLDGEANIKENTLNCVRLFKEKIPKFEAKMLNTLHAKIIIIDRKIAYIGSANWYKYSLETAFEIVMRGSYDNIRELGYLINDYWNKGEYIDTENGNMITLATTNTKLKEYNSEILDPLIKKVLSENPKAFIIGKKNK